MQLGYETHLATIKGWLGQFENLLPIGRAGMFKYNNQDHAMATGLLAARTALGVGRFDPWAVNIDAEYHEEQRSGLDFNERCANLLDTAVIKSTTDAPSASAPRLSLSPGLPWSGLGRAAALALFSIFVLWGFASSRG